MEQPGNGPAIWQERSEQYEWKLKTVTQQSMFFEKIAKEGWYNTCRLNKLNLPSEYEDPIDRPPQFRQVVPIRVDNLKSLIGIAIKGTQNASSKLVDKILGATGLNKRGVVLNDVRMSQVPKGIRELFSYHFCNNNKQKLRKVLCRLIFDRDLFGEESGENMACTLASSVT